jgi:hypothetical protein
VSGTTADSNRAASIENYGNGWYRCRLTATCNSTGTNNGFSAVLLIASGSTRAPSFAGTTTDVLYGWGAQTETGSIATSYIPTTAAPVTRNADVISVTGAVSGCIGQTEGTIYAEVDLRNFVTNGRILAITDGISASNAIEFRINTSSRIRGLITASTNIVADINTSTNQPIGIYKMALAYAQNDFALYINGTQIGTDTDGQMPINLSKINIGTSAVDLNLLNDRIRAAALYTTRLTNAELAALTTL